MEASKLDDDVWRVAGASGCFDNVRVVTMDWSYTFWYEAFMVGLDGYQTPLYWLATLIVRETVAGDLHGIMDWIEELGESGSLDREGIERMWTKEKVLQCNPETGIA